MGIPDPADVRSIALMGFGTMGHTWATTLLMGGLEVFVHESVTEVVEGNRARLEGYLASLREKKRWDGDVAATCERLHFVDSEQALAECGAPVLLEVIFEDLTLKREVYRRLGERMPKETIFWTHTSCLDVLRLGEASGRPERFLGTHGMSPVHLMKGVEVVRHERLDPAILDFTLAMMRRIGKEPFVTDNVPGFIVNNGLIAWVIHYVHMLERRQATTAEIDKALCTCLGHPQGVFMLIDRIGINTTLLVAEELYKATLDPRYKAPPLLYTMRRAGCDGFKTGRGFYDWSNPRKPVPVPYDELTAAQG